MQHTTLDIDNLDDDAILGEERFFHIMSGTIMRLGIWSIELCVNADKILEIPDQVARYRMIAERITNRAL